MPRHSPRGCINSGGGVAWLAHEKKKKIKKSRRRRPTKLPDHHRRVRGHQIGRRGRRRRRGGGGGGLDLGERGGDLMLWGCGSLSLSLSLSRGEWVWWRSTERRGEERSGDGGGWARVVRLWCSRATNECHLCFCWFLFCLEQSLLVHFI